jgi:hypothetical protein
MARKANFEQGIIGSKSGFNIGFLQTPVHTFSLQDKTPTGQYILIVKTQGKRDVIKMVTVKK